MSDRYLVEALLRPPVEFYTAIVCFLVGIVCLMSPWVLALTPSIGLGLTVLCWLIAARRFWQGFL